jgi:SAM-dependent methyltransferase
MAAELAETGMATARHLEQLNAQAADLVESVTMLDERLKAVSDGLRDTRRLAERVPGLSKEMAWLAGQIALIEGKARTEEPSPTDAKTAAGGAAVPDAFYWHYEAAMRGSEESIEAKLAQYEPLAAELRAGADGDDAAGAPLWLDLGCGEGTFGMMLQRWGWRVRGMDASEAAVETCRARGIDAEVGTLPHFLLNELGERPRALSAMQVIEHLPAGHWLPFFQYAHAALPSGGALLVETINPVNLRALANHFYGDLTHTWPAHPATLRLMAEFAGFTDVRLMWLNPDPTDDPQDYAIIAVKG